MNKESIKRFFKSFFSGFSNVSKKSWNFIKKINSSGIRRFVAVVFMVISGIAIFLDTVGVLLFSADPGQLSKILNYKFDFDLFSYINYTEYYSVLLGGYILDVIFWGLIIALAIWLHNKKNIFCSIKTRILFLLFFVAGSMMFASGVYYAMPEVGEPIKKMVIKHKECKYKKMLEGQKEKGIKNYQEKRGYFDEGRGYMREIHFKNLGSDLDKEMMYFFSK